MHLDNPRVVQTGQNTSLAAESSQGAIIRPGLSGLHLRCTRRAIAKRGWKMLFDNHLALQMRIIGKVADTTAALAEKKGNQYRFITAHKKK